MAPELARAPKRNRENFGKLNIVRRRHEKLQSSNSNDCDYEALIEEARLVLKSCTVLYWMVYP